MINGKKTIVVIGGAHGGPTAAFFARKNDPFARVILIEKNSDIVFNQKSLSYYLKENSFQKENLTYDLNIDILTNTECLEVDIDAKVLLIKSSNGLDRLKFDSLIYAGGAISKDIDIPLNSSAKKCSFRNLNDLKIIKEALKNGIKKVLVLGAGFYGIEAVNFFSSLKNLEVSLYDEKKRVFSWFSYETSQIILENLSNKGIKIFLGNEKPDFLKYDLVVTCIGLKPRSELLLNAGASLDRFGLIRVDDRMATTLPNVFACGSAVSVPSAVSKDRQWTPHGAIIEATSKIAGMNASGSFMSIKPFCGSLVTNIDNRFFARCGIKEEEAPESKWICVKNEDGFIKLLINEEKNLILGGEVFGSVQILKKLDLITIGVMEKWPIERLMELDLAFEPSLENSFDILKEASFRAYLHKENIAKAISKETLTLWSMQKKDFLLLDFKKEKISPTDLININKPIVLINESFYDNFYTIKTLSNYNINNIYYLIK